jgi:hypothetical protein
VSAVALPPRWYLPVRKPPASVDHGSSPIPVMHCGGNHFPLDFARKQAILRLQRHRHLYAHGLGRGNYELQLPAREIRQADVMNFPGLHRIIEERQRFFDRRVHVSGVELIEVDRINAQARERSVQRTM